MHRLLITTLALLTALARAEDVVRVAGSAALVAPFSGAVTVLKNQDIDLRIIGESNTPSAINGVALGICEIGLSTRPVLVTERATYPDRPLTETTLGYQALVFSVSNDVWAAGVRSLSKADMTRIYEGKLKSWEALGGPPRRIKFFNPEPGRGIWEFFAGWLYGDMRKAPASENFELASTPEEARNLVEFNGGALAVLPPVRAESPGVHGLAYRDEKGKLWAATLENVRKGVYPIVRPVIAVTAFRPSGANRKILDFMLSAQGQELVRRAEMVPVMEEPAD